MYKLCQIYQNVPCASCDYIRHIQYLVISEVKIIVVLRVRSASDVSNTDISYTEEYSLDTICVSVCISTPVTANY